MSSKCFDLIDLYGMDAINRIKFCNEEDKAKFTELAKKRMAQKWQDETEMLDGYSPHFANIITALGKVRCVADDIEYFAKHNPQSPQAAICYYRANMLREAIKEIREQLVLAAGELGEDGE